MIEGALLPDDGVDEGAVDEAPVIAYAEEVDQGVHTT